ncbi:MAG: hypothetical protein VKQ33_12215, partial [Candidatus Sericytochromatia bacterium]|nr:hypothetical protein [Candidatus Sericytochromatia bacterium]
MVMVGLYVLVTAPFLPLMLYVHRLGGAYAGLFMAAMVLQLIPIGLAFLPLGLVGVGLLAVSLVGVGRRLTAFRAAGLHNPEVHGRWSREYVANALALGLALEQKGVAWGFLAASQGDGLRVLWGAVLPASGLVWALLAWLIVRERRAGAPPAAEPWRGFRGAEDR